MKGRKGLGRKAFTSVGFEGFSHRASPVPEAPEGPREEKALYPASGFESLNHRASPVPEAPEGPREEKALYPADGFESLNHRASPVPEAPEGPREEKALYPAGGFESLNHRMYYYYYLIDIKTRKKIYKWTLINIISVHFFPDGFPGRVKGIHQFIEMFVMGWLMDMDHLMDHHILQAFGAFLGQFRIKPEGPLCVVAASPVAFHFPVKYFFNFHADRPRPFFHKPGGRLFQEIPVVFIQQGYLLLLAGSGTDRHDDPPVLGNHPGMSPAFGHFKFTGNAPDKMDLPVFKRFILRGGPALEFTLMLFYPGDFR